MVKLLVADDEQKICRLLESFFSERGFHVFLAHDGEEALACIRRERPHLIFLDLHMPGMDGLSVLKEARKVDETMKIIIVTAIEDEETVRLANPVHGHDVRMTQRRQYPSFLHESSDDAFRGNFGEQHLDRHPTPESCIECQEYGAHPAPGQLLLDPKIGQQGFLEPLQEHRHGRAGSRPIARSGRSGVYFPKGILMA